jgi:putative oxidoreductase
MKGGTVMVKKLFQTDDDVSRLVLRVLLAVVFFPHGAQKVFGWFGGPGFAGQIDAFQQYLGIPPFLGVLAILAEFLGPLGLITGLLTRVAALGIMTNMVVAVFMVHMKIGFFMNWFGKQAGEGFEYHLLAIAIALALVIKGGGKWSADGVIAKRLG